MVHALNPGGLAAESLLQNIVILCLPTGKTATSVFHGSGKLFFRYVRYSGYLRGGSRSYWVWNLRNLGYPLGKKKNTIENIYKYRHEVNFYLE